jgi:hypothetical protein
MGSGIDSLCFGRPFVKECKAWLEELYVISAHRTCDNAPQVERCVENIVSQVPVPPRGVKRVQVQIGEV